MRIDEIVKKLADALATWGGSRSIRVSVARDPFDVLEVLTIGPEAALLIVQWDGDETEDPELSEDDATTGPARNNNNIIVGQGLGLDLKRDWRLIAGRGTRKSVLQRLDETRAFALSILYPADETSLRRLRYRGCEPMVTPDGIPLAAYRLKFSLVAMVNVDATETEV